MPDHSLKTTLFLIAGGRELQLPENYGAFKKAMLLSLLERSAKIIMLSDTSLIPENELHSLTDYKTVLVLESEMILKEEDAWMAAYELQNEIYLPNVISSGFDYQVIQMKKTKIKYEDFELVDRFAR